MIETNLALVVRVQFDFPGFQKTSLPPESGRETSMLNFFFLNTHAYSGLMGREQTLTLVGS